MSTRLDRLFTLLASSTSSSARSLAAQQLGEIQQTHPGELHNLLTRLHPLLKAKRWETRIGASAAIAAILKELPQFDPDRVKKEQDEQTCDNGDDDDEEDFQFDFDINEIMGRGEETALGASQGSEFEMAEGSQATSSEEQKKRLNKELGLDVAAKLGVLDPDEEMVTADDLKANNENLSAREKNLKRRQKRKKEREQEASKKKKLEGNFYAVSDEQKDALGSSLWPLKIFCETLRKDLKSLAWEDRHGAATALREIVGLHGSSAGKAVGPSSSENRIANLKWLHQLATDILTVLARDRFGDFVSDQVVAPVRETTAMVLGNLFKLMPEKSKKAVINVLLDGLIDGSDWQCRHGGYLGLKYILAGSGDQLSLSMVVDTIYPKVFKGLKDVVDDVVSVAAGALVPVVKRFTKHIDVNALSELLWNCFTDLDDLTGSTQSTMKLLSEIVVIRVPDKCGQQMKDLIPRLFPFFHHSNSMVRQAVLQTMKALVSQKSLALEFLPHTVGPILSHLFQRSLVESEIENLKLIEATWSEVCDNCPLAPLLTTTCPLYASWFALISKHNFWPLPNELLINKNNNGGNENLQYLGGSVAQHTTDELERNNLATRSRCTGARMLGKLAGFISQPVPGFDYSKETSSPVELFVEKILLPNLTKSAFQTTSIALVIQAWCQHHPEQVRSITPDSLKTAIHEYLVKSASTTEFEETSQAWTQLQTDVSDLLATLKYHKIFILEGTETIPDRPTLAEMTTMMQYPLEATLKKSKLKPSRIDTLLSRQTDIKQRFERVDSDIQSLTIMTLGTVAGALVNLDFLPEKMNPVIKPLMESIKKETLAELQTISAQKLVLLLEMCMRRGLSSPAEKVTKNLIHFAFADHFTHLEAVVAKHSASIISSVVEDKQTNVHDESIQTRGSKVALREIVKHFKREATSKPPKFFDKIVVPFQQDHLWKILDPTTELMPYLYALSSVADCFDESLHHELLKTCDCLANVICHPEAGVRHLGAESLATLATFLTIPTLTSVMKSVVSRLLDSTNTNHRRGAIETMHCIVNRLDLDFVPYIVLFVVPVLGRMSDQDNSIRMMAANMFAKLIKLIPLDSSEVKVEAWPQDLQALRAKEKVFIDELMNLKNVQDFRLPVKINADLRSYQADGIKWLAFLNRYKLHGILCDDMGLGKTLQAICILASDHFSRSNNSKLSLEDGGPCPSLVICPPTLCHHWASEIEKFTEEQDLTSFVYNGNSGMRQLLRSRLNNILHPMLAAGAKAECKLVVITSYEIVRNDLDFFSRFHWNYIVLDEGHAIRNTKTKTTLAIKSLKAHHRLILSGTPIQNSVIELWSLFDFLMPGFLGTEQQFNQRYTKAIVGSRGNPGGGGKTVSKESQEAGVLAMEALHRQVLPFILRRMKEDVLKDLPPKITQDYFCELSPIQRALYEDFAKKQKDKTRTESSKSHVFQALQYLRKVCNHPKLVLNKEHDKYDLVQGMLTEAGSNLDSIGHASKLPALKQLLHECGIGLETSNNGSMTSIVGQHRALVFCQLKAMMDLVESDLFKAEMPGMTYLRLDGSIPANDRHSIVTRFNNDISIDVLLLSTSVGGLGLNLTGADTVIFVEHDWNPMKDLQAMDRAHRIGQKKVVNVYRLITRNTVEEKILGLQKFKLMTANTVISRDNASLSSMNTNQIFDLFSLDDDDGTNVRSRNKEQGQAAATEAKGGIKAILENLPELWDSSQYNDEYDLDAYAKK